MNTSSAHLDPRLAEIAIDLELTSLLSVAPDRTPAVERLVTEVVAAQRQGGTQLLGLHVAFVGLAEAIAAELGCESLSPLETFHTTQRDADGTRAVDTLTVLIPRTGAKPLRVSLRRYVNRAIGTFKGPRVRRTGYPSSPMQHTKRWTNWRPTLDGILAMSRAERHALAEALYAEILSLPKSLLRVPHRTVQDPFAQVIEDFPRPKRRGERGGAALQGMAYGFVCADAPGLTSRSANVHTGASRAGLVGDVDGYDGPFLQLAVEVKDKALADFDELVDFLSNLADHPDVTAFVICQSVTQEVRLNCTRHAISVLTLDEMRTQVRLWTAGKQLRAVRETLAFYQHIQRSPALADRFVEFLMSRRIDFGLRSTTSSEAGDPSEGVSGCARPRRCPFPRSSPA